MYIDISQMWNFHGSINSIKYERCRSFRSCLTISYVTDTRGLDSLILQRKLDFESPTTQNFNISIRPQNGFCDPIEHFLFIRTTDANDPPVLLPKNVSKTVNEGGVGHKA